MTQDATEKDSQGKPAECPLPIVGSTRCMLVWLVLLTSMLAIAYWPAMDAPFLFDDNHAIVENPHIRSIATSMTVPEQSTLSSRPIVSVTLAVNYSISQLDPRSYRVVNLLLHLINALLVCLTLRNHFSVLISYALATLWALHPLCSETVIYISQRTELLATLFILLTLWLSSRFLRSGSKGMLALAVLSCALGMASKEIVFAAPLLVILYDRVFVSQTFGKAVGEHWQLHLPLFLTWGVLAFVMLTSPRSDTVGFDLGIAWQDYLRTQAGVIAMYVGKVFWPTDLSLYHDVPLATQWSTNLLAGVALAAAFVFAVVGTAYRRWRVAFALIVFFLILAPSSSFVPIVTEYAAERRMYLPLAAVLVLLAALLTRLPREVAAYVLLGLAVCVLPITNRRAVVYANEVTVWQDVVDQYPKSERAVSSLGMAQLKAGNIEQGVATLEQMLTFSPNDLEAHANLAAAYLLLNDSPKAALHARKAITLQPKRVAAHVNLGIALARQEKMVEAEAAFRDAIGIAPNQPEANFHLAKVLMLREAFDDAIVHLERTLTMDPSNEDAKRLLGLARSLRG